MIKSVLLAKRGELSTIVFDESVWNSVTAKMLFSGWDDC